MSVTFTLNIEDSDLAGFEIYNYETEQSWMACDYTTAKALWEELGAEPQAWSLSAKYELPDATSINMSNSNARDVLRVLGLEGEDLSGSCEAEDLLGRCLIAIAVAPDAELIPYEQTGANGAKVIDMGRAKGYIEEKLIAISELCRGAMTHHRTVQWG